MPGDALGMINEHFRAALQCRLGYDLLPPSPGTPCVGLRFCANRPTTAEQTTAHVLGQCKLRSGIRNARHNAVVRDMAKILEEAGFDTRVEPAGLFAAPHAHLRPDILAVDPATGSRSCLDVSFTSHLCLNVIENSHKERGYAAARYAREKIRKYSAASAKANITFVPLQGEIIGGFSNEARKYITAVAKRHSIRTGVHLSRTVDHVYARLSMAQQRANAEALFCNGRPTLDHDQLSAPLLADVTPAEVPRHA